MRLYIPILILLVVNADASRAGERSSSLDHGNVPWSRLTYAASAFFMTLESEVRQESIAAEKAAEQLVLNDQKDVNKLPAENIIRIDNFSEGFGKKAHYTLWFDQNGEALQRKKLVKGKRNEIKIYRFSSCGYFTLRKKFPSANFDENFSQWEEAKKSYTEFSSGLCGKQPVYDVNALLYLISALDIKEIGYQKDITTFSDGKLLQVKLVAKKMTSIYGDFKINSSQKEITVDDSIDVLELHLMPVTKNKKERESFRFLGLKGNIKVYLDLTHQLIVRLRGNVDVVGTLDINLKNAELLH